MPTTNAARPPLFTIGYEKATSPALLGELKRNKVGILVDTRAVAASRRPGFSKRQLAASLDEQGIGYLHLQKLGTPAEGRHAARGGKIEALFQIYEAHLQRDDAREQLEELIDIVRSGRRVCLLCFERDHAQCHRDRIAELVCERVGVGVEHLVPPPI
jgi:uncharacterized protein (DUF488 family)